MPHVSTHKLSKKQEEKLYDTLKFAFANLNKEDQVWAFLNTLLSPIETLMFAKRLAILVLLNEGVPQIEISRNLNVTRETVSRVALLQEIKGNDGLDFVIRKLSEQKKNKEIKEVLLKIAGYSVRAAGGRVKPEVF